MLDRFWQRILPYQMTRIQEPDLLIDHDSGGGGCKRFLGRPIVEPFAYSGISSRSCGGDASSKLNWFPYPRASVTAQPPAYSRACSKVEMREESPIIIVHNNNSIDVLDENTRWGQEKLPNYSERGTKTKSKSSKSSKSSGKDSVDKVSNSSSSSKSGVTTPCINNCSGAQPSVTSPCVNSTRHSHHHPSQNPEDEEQQGQHLIIRYIHCNERPNKKQLVTLGLISLAFLIVLVVLLALFLSPSRNKLSEVKDNGISSDPFISSDTNLNTDEGELEDSYEEDGETPYYSSTSSSNIDLKKVSKLSWDMLNNNQDQSSGGLPLGSGNGEGEIILPAKMIYTSSGDSQVAQQGAQGEGQKKRSCCRTQKYSQVIKRDGCEPLTIVNKMCFGQCVSVWVPGLFASFPVCRPSKSTFKTVTLTCGRNKEKRKRVRIEKVRRCSCMEIEPTAASL